MEKLPDLDQLTAEQLRTMVAQLNAQLVSRDQAIAQQAQTLAHKDEIIARRDTAIQRYQIREEQMSHEIALLRRHRYGKRSEGLDKHQLSESPLIL